MTRHDYFPFGEEITAPTTEVMKFTGHERHFGALGGANGTGDLDYMHARYYTPMVGRFLSVDPVITDQLSVPQSWNRYSYVRARPVVLTDPSGREVQKCCAPAEIARGVLDHCWLKTDTVEAGLGCEGVVSCSGGVMPGDRGGKCWATQISDHSSCGYRQPTCRVVNNVDEECVSRALTLDPSGLGASLGLWGPTNNCWTLVARTLDTCSTATTPWTVP